MFSSVLGGLDTAVWRFYRDHEFLVAVAEVYTQWGVSSILTPLALFVGVGLIMKNKPISLAVLPIVSLHVCGVLTAYLKSWTAVDRPPRIDWLAGASGGSFPSGHVANTTACLVAIAVVLTMGMVSSRPKALIWISTGTLVALMGWARLALRVHWFSDVVGGWLLGVAVAYGCHVVLTRFRRANPLRRLGHRAS